MFFCDKQNKEKVENTRKIGRFTMKNRWIERSAGGEHVCVVKSKLNVPKTDLLLWRPEKKRSTHMAEKMSDKFSKVFVCTENCGQQFIRITLLCIFRNWIYYGIVLRTLQHTASSRGAFNWWHSLLVEHFDHLNFFVRINLIRDSWRRVYEFRTLDRFTMTRSQSLQCRAYEAVFYF